MKRAVIVGGGIGGLTAALALRGNGWRVTVFERAERLEAVGSGLAVAPNALRALDTIGLGAPVRRLSGISGAGGLRNSRGGWLNRVDVDRFAEHFGDPTVVLPRPRLVELLAAELQASELRLATRVTAVDADSGTVTTDDGPVEAELVVAADGIGSRTRAALFGDHPGPVYSGSTTWRVIVDAPATPPVAAEYWGRGAAVGVVPLADGRVYLYAMARCAPDRHADDERAELLRRFGSWAQPIPELFATAEVDRVLRNDVHLMATPLPALHRGRVAILGDAAHAMTPNLGQGACTAMEDAVVLAHEVSRGSGLPGYTRARLPRTSMMVAESAKVGRIALLTNPVAIALRNAGMRLTGLAGTGPALRRGARYYDWRPPTAASQRVG